MKAGRCVVVVICFFMLFSSCDKKDAPVPPEAAFPKRSINTQTDKNRISIYETIYKKEKNPDLPVKHIYIHKKISNALQAINILEVDVKKAGVIIKPVLAQDRIFGFEHLSEIDKRLKPYALVNAGFNGSYGQPVGIFVKDGKILSLSGGNFPSLIIDSGGVRLEEISYKKFMYIQNKKIKIDDINLLAPKDKIVLYTPEYALTNRLKTNNITLVIRDGKIKDSVKTNKETSIPKDGVLISFVGKSISKFPKVNIGDMVRFQNIPAVSSKTQAYECGGWIVKDKKIVIKDKEPWIGSLTQPAPRTAVGIKDGKVIFVTVDGRQPGYSVGMTGKELAKFLLFELKVYNAALLDGGASTEMIVRHSIVNKPSAGYERLIAAAFAIFINSN